MGGRRAGDRANVKLWISLVGLAIALIFFRQRRTPSPFPPSLSFLLHAPWRRLSFPPDEGIVQQGIEPGMAVLEVGPGDGYLSRAIREQIGGALLVGVDVQLAMLLRLRGKLGEIVPVLVCASGSELPLRDQGFDLVSLVHVLGEISDRTRAVTEYRRVLRPGGTLSITEGMPDPDFIGRARLLRIVRPAGFEPTHHSGGRLHYTWRFVNTRATEQSHLR